MEGKKPRRKTPPEPFLLRSATILLPYLTPPELATISQTCKTLNKISKSITTLRTQDASRGLESLPIPFLNPISADPKPYPYFLYTPTQTLPSQPNSRQPWGLPTQHCSNPDPFLFRVRDAEGCHCHDEYCVDGTCYPCFVTRECGPSCRCGPGCGNRDTQGGVKVSLKIVKRVLKSWCLLADQFIPNGMFVCEYAGEVLSTKEARERQREYDNKGRLLSPALLVVKEHLGNTCLRINIDATRIGNVARFINHSCDGGNLDIVIVRCSGALLPRVCLFASRDIEKNEELTFSYGDVRVDQEKGRPCYCGTEDCAGILPSENT